MQIYKLYIESWAIIYMTQIVKRNVKVENRKIQMHGRHTHFIQKHRFLTVILWIFKFDHTQWNSFDC